MSLKHDMILSLYEIVSLTVLKLMT